MSTKTAPDKSFSKNSLCQSEKAHDWISTTAANYRKCNRTDCQAAQRLQDGQWIDVVTTIHTPRKPVPQQAALWA